MVPFRMIPVTTGAAISSWWQEAEMAQYFDTVVVGGGIAGLTSAALLSREGQAVALFERAASLGGRASTKTIDGFQFNLGPHALFRGGHAMRVLHTLGLFIDEPKVGTSGSVAVFGGTARRLPV